MYESFFGLKEKPFSLLPDPAYLYPTRQHEMAITLLEYSLENQAGFCVITGQAGMGKTTLMRRLLNRIGKDITVGLITNTQHSFGELLHWVLHAFSLENSAKTRAELHQVFMDHLIRQYAQDRRTMLIIDEAQNMSSDSLEELRMLSNVNSEKDLLLQIILVGQPPLRELLSRPELEQFAQRIAVDYNLKALGRDETRDYIRHRVRVAGGASELFTDDACAAIFEYTRGIPRLINLLSDFALVYAYAGEVGAVDGELVEQVIREREKNGTLPIFAHERQSPAATATGAEASPRPEARLSEPAAEGASAHANPAPGLAGHKSQEPPASFGTTGGEFSASSVASRAELRAARLAVALRQGVKSGRMPAVEMEQTQPAASVPEPSPAPLVANESANPALVPPAAPTPTAHVESTDAAAPKPDVTVAEQTVESPHEVRAGFPARRHVAAAAVIVLSLGAALAWHFFDRPARATAVTASATRSLLGQATATPPVAKNMAPARNSTPPADSPATPAVLPQAAVESAVAVTGPVKAKNQPLAAQARVTRASSQKTGDEREALRGAVGTYQHSIAAEHKTPMREHNRDKERELETLREAVSAYQDSMAAEQVPSAPESDKSNPPAQDAAKAQLQPEMHAAAQQKSGPLYPP